MDITESVLKRSKNLKTFLNKYGALGGETELVTCWSGGRDSTVLLILLRSLIDEVPPFSVVLIPYPSAVISEEGRASVIKYWASYNIQINILDHKHPNPQGEPRDEVCKQCKQVRRQAFTNYINSLDKRSHVTILTGQTCSDLAAYAMELFALRLAEKLQVGEGSWGTRELEVLNRFEPVFDYSHRLVLKRCRFHIGRSPSCNGPVHLSRLG